MISSPNLTFIPSFWIKIKQQVNLVVYLWFYISYEGDTELIAKVQVMAEYAAEQTIAIGDSITDLNMALHASIVFARDRLAKHLDEHQKPYITTVIYFVQIQIQQRICNFLWQTTILFCYLSYAN